MEEVYAICHLCNAYDLWSNGPVTNPLCPDYSSHSQNAAEILFPRMDRDYRPNEEEAAAIDALAEAEYRACEGH